MIGAVYPYTAGEANGTSDYFGAQATIDPNFTFVQDRYLDNALANYGTLNFPTDSEGVSGAVRRPMHAQGVAHRFGVEPALAYHYRKGSWPSSPHRRRAQ